MSIDTFSQSSIICDKTAFKYYRTPPRYLGLYPSLPQCQRTSHYRELRDAPLIADVLGFPLHVVTDSPDKRSQTKTIRFHVVNNELPFGSSSETDHGFLLASPELTLFTLSRTLTFNQLVMAMYEMCGRFTFFKPTAQLDSALAQCGMTLDDGWSRVVSQSGRPTGLWTRPPLIDVAGLEGFASALGNTRGSKLFMRAVGCVSGVTASPFEAQLSMLLFMDPNLGGWGYKNIDNNFTIRYNEGAQTLTSHRQAEIDMRILAPDGTREHLLECQGKIIHDRENAGTKDALRATALQAMGFDVTLITNDQVSDPQKFDVLRLMLSESLGIKWVNKTPKQELAEHDLRADIFGDWIDLANEPTTAERKARYRKNKAKRTPGNFPKRKKAPNGSGNRCKYANVGINQEGPE